MTMPSWSAATGPSAGGSSGRVDMTMPIRPLVHVANLPSTTTERDIREMFGSLGQIQSAKIVTSRSGGEFGLVYGFVEYVDVAAAERAIRTMDGWLWFGTPIKVCWAKHSMHPDAIPEAGTGFDRSATAATHPTNATNSHIFVGDLSPEVDDASLHGFFSRFPSLADVRVMYDAETGKSRGFGFISFKNKHDAEACIAAMQGQWLGGRQIRVNWANQKNHSHASGLAMATNAADVGYPSISQKQSSASYPTKATQTHPHAFTSKVPSPYTTSFDMSEFPGLPRRHTALEPQSQLSNPSSKYNYEQVLAHAPPNLTSVYVGNLSPLTSQEDLVRIFSPFNHGQGPVEARIPAGRGYGFVRLASHEQAASAICTLGIQGVFMHSRWLRFGWQKDRDPGTTPTRGPLPHRAESAPTLPRQAHLYRDFRPF